MRRFYFYFLNLNLHLIVIRSKGKEEREVNYSGFFQYKGTSSTYIGILINFIYVRWTDLEALRVRMRQ